MIKEALESLHRLILETIESVIAQHEGANLQQINDELTLKGLEPGFLDPKTKTFRTSQVRMVI